MRIAYFSPLPPDRSGIADYSRELLEQLIHQAQITLYSPSPDQVVPEIRDTYDLRNLSRFPGEYPQFDLALYQMGNSALHDPYYPLMVRYPGVVVLHDYGIHHFILHRTLGKGDFAGYARELGYALGTEGMRIAQAIRQGFQDPPVYDYPLNNRLLDASIGVVVHSKYVADKIQRQGFDKPLYVVPALIQEFPGQSKRNEIGFAEHDILFASFGLITSAKQIDRALLAFNELQQDFPNSHYFLVGDVMPEIPLMDMIDTMGLGNKVHHIGYVPTLREFVDWIHTADIVINLRYPTVGETSATALRAMAAGRPLIVNNCGWYREIPDDAAVKVDPLDDESLVDAMRTLASSVETREKMGNAGKKYAVEVCNPAQVASQYVMALENITAYYRYVHD